MFYVNKYNKDRIHEVAFVCSALSTFALFTVNHSAPESTLNCRICDFWTLDRQDREEG